MKESRGCVGSHAFVKLVVTATSETDYCSNDGTLSLALSLGSKYRVVDMAPSVDRPYSSCLQKRCLGLTDSWAVM